MKNVLATLILLATISLTASAQSLVFLPDPSATLIGTFTVQIGIVRDANGNPTSSKLGPNTTTVVGGFRTANGTVSYQIVTPSIRYSGTDGALIDQVATPLLYAWLSQAAIEEGTARGFTPAPGCIAPAVVDNFAEACVTRTGGGINTHFEPCGTDNYARWSYEVCTPQGSTAPSISFLGYARYGAVCGSACQSTLPAGAGGDGYNSGSIQ